MKNEISRRGFLISSTVGATGLLFAQPSMAGGTAGQLLCPGGSLGLPEKFSPSVLVPMQRRGVSEGPIFYQGNGRHGGKAFA